MPFSHDDLLARLNTLGIYKKYWLALSGGLDSTVLLHALCELRPSVEIAAIHINHGLYDDAQAWGEHCQELCLRWGVEFQLVKVNAQAETGQSPEEAARDARYHALQAFVDEQHALLTAHHQDDQVETFLLQFFRGAGVQGLAAMPESSSFSHGVHLRPLLDVSREELHVYAKSHQLQWLEDHSNLDERFDRNYIRQQLMPMVRSRWPSIGKVASRAASLQAEAAQLLNERAKEDLESCLSSPLNTLSVSKLSELSLHRQRNLLRYWIRSQKILLPSRAVMEEILKSYTAPADREPCVQWAEQMVRRYQGQLFLLKTCSAEPLPDVTQWELQQVLELPGLGWTLRFDTLPEALKGYLSGHQYVEIRFRKGGERIQLPGRAHHHRLKHLLQEIGVPPWLRDRLPLVYLGGRLLAVLGLEQPLLAAEVCQ